MSYRRYFLSTLLLAGIVVTSLPTDAFAYSKIGGRFTQDPLNKYYYNGAGTAVHHRDANGDYYLSHWSEVGNGITAWNNTQNTRVWFISTSDKSQSILDFEDSWLSTPDLLGVTSMWNGNTQLSVDQTQNGYWYWAKVEINYSPETKWRTNVETGVINSNTYGAAKLKHNASHETGHALGLDHVTAAWNTDKLMYPSAKSFYSYGVVGPTTDEADGVRSIYGPLN